MWEKKEGKKRRGWQKMRWLGSITYSMDMNLSKLWKTVKDREASTVGVHGVAKTRTRLRTEQQQQSDWLQYVSIFMCLF